MARTMTLVKTLRRIEDWVKVESVLTDGKDRFECKDRHKRVDGWWFYLVNVNTDQGGWFRGEDLGELALLGRVKRAPRRFGIRHGQRRFRGAR